MKTACPHGADATSRRAGPFVAGQRLRARFAVFMDVLRSMVGPNRRFALVLLAGLVAGCYESEFALDPTPQLQTDSRLTGSWRCVDADVSDEAITLTVVSSQARTYAITWQESGKPPDRFEGYASSLKGTTLLNVRDLNATTKPWLFIRYTLLQPSILFIQVVHERLLAGSVQSREAVRNAVERQRLNPALYEDSIVCMRTRT
jgi:hypothetical protein